MIARPDPKLPQITCDPKLRDPKLRATPTGLRGDWLNGGTGDDYVIGYTGDDVVLGGLGADLLVGGAGDDTLAGDTDFTSLQMDWTVTQGINIFFPGFRCSQ